MRKLYANILLEEEVETSLLELYKTEENAAF